MGHNGTQAAAKKEKVKASDRTPEQILKDIRNNVAAKLFVTPNDVRFLLGEYDKLVATSEQQAQVIQLSVSAALEAQKNSAVPA